jgi:hypothetical protein
MSGNEASRLLGEAGQQLIKDTIADPIAKFRALPEGPEKARKRVSWGAGLLSAGAYIAYTTWWSNYAGMSGLVRHYTRALHAPLVDSWTVYGWSAAMLFGLLWVVVGVRGARGPRHVMGTFWALARVGVAGWALYDRWYVDDRSIDPWLQGGYVTLLGSSSMLFFVCARGSGQRAVRLVQQQIAQQMKTFRVGRPRSF